MKLYLFIQSHYVSALYVVPIKHKHPETREHAWATIAPAYQAGVKAGRARAEENDKLPFDKRHEAVRPETDACETFAQFLILKCEAQAAWSLPVIPTGYHIVEVDLANFPVTTNLSYNMVTDPALLEKKLPDIRSHSAEEFGHAMARADRTQAERDARTKADAEARTMAAAQKTAEKPERKPEPIASPPPGTKVKGKPKAEAKPAVKAKPSGKVTLADLITKVQGKPKAAPVVTAGAGVKKAKAAKATKPAKAAK
jgi:hypothetical protein